MSDRSKQEIEEEKHGLAMKFFDYAEVPIKEWIANYLNVTQEELFGNEKDESDIINIQINNNYHQIYYTIWNTPGQPNSVIPSSEYKKHENLRKAMSIMFDAVRVVFPCVVKAMKKLNSSMENVFPKFSQETLSFSFNMVNHLKIKKDSHTKNILNIYQQVAKVKQRIEQGKVALKVASHKEKEEIEAMLKNGKEILDNLSKSLSTEMMDANAITDAAIAAREDECKAANAIFEKSVKLHMIIDQDVADDDAIMRRLPVFGMAYQDPEEDSFVDKLKKEYGVE